ncbi:MAG: TlpA family protein disulfide reductase [Alphaproteobacteria bacterium]|nr:TlpA family protein disulfide reductase [Alphaproteobacteria bacterium]
MSRLLVSLFVICVVAAPARSGESVDLDAMLKKHVVERPLIQGPAVNRDRLDGTVVVVSFFASWCPPCVIEFAHLNELRADYDADDVTIIAINLFEDWSSFKDDGGRLDRFLARTGPTFSIVASDDETEHIFGGIDRIPTVFVFDRAGRAALHFIHAAGATVTNPDMTDLRAAIEAAL